MKAEPPRRQTRRDIERELEQQRRKSRALGLEYERRIIASIERQLAEMRQVLTPAEFEKLKAELGQVARMMREQLRRRKRHRGDGNMPAPVEPPRGPGPLAGGAAAPLEFD